MSEPANQYSPTIHILRKGNPVVFGDGSETCSTTCAAGAGANLTLGEKMISLDNMAFLDENEEDSPPTDDEESVG